MAAQVKLAMLCPSRSRPESVVRMGDAWEKTGASVEIDLIWVLDLDDPRINGYREALRLFPWMKAISIPVWEPMVPKLNRAARWAATRYAQVGFLGDDHVPRTMQWCCVLAAALDQDRPVIAYGKDGFQDEALPTWWAMSSNIITKLGRMVPANVQHLYCDNAIYQLGAKSGSLVYLPEILIEHMHPVAGKAEWDEGHTRVNRRQQYDRDRLAFEAWVVEDMVADATLVRELGEV